MRAYRDPLALYEELKTAWSAQSSSVWTADMPAKGQCSVNALVVQDLFGGEILKTRTPGGMHFYNRVGNVRWDLTIGQFASPIPFEDLPATREDSLADTSPAQYAALRERL